MLEITSYTLKLFSKKNIDEQKLNTEGKISLFAVFYFVQFTK